MSKHTPGPWKCSTFAGQWNVWPNKKHHKSNGDAVAYYMTPEDARLIAAAPDMLAALRRAALALAFAAETSQAMSDDYAAVSAAIAKATGCHP